MGSVQRAMGQGTKADREAAPKATEDARADSEDKETAGSSNPLGQVDTDALLKEAQENMQAGLEQAQKAAADAMKDMGKLAGTLFGGFGKKK